MADKAKRDEEKQKEGRKRLRDFESAKKDSLQVTHQQVWSYSAMCRRGCQQPTNVELFRAVPVQATRFAQLTAGYLEAVKLLYIGQGVFYIHYKACQYKIIGNSYIGV